MTSNHFRPCFFALGLLAPLFGSVLLAQPTRSSNFTGIYAGVDVSLQNLIGGSHINGVDVLQQASRPVISLSVGARYQAPFGTVIGFDIGAGLTRGNLAQRETSPPLEVDYHNRSQRHWNITLGQTLGQSRTLAFVYLSEVTRHFDVHIRQHGRAYTQRDEQGLLRFGAGVEQRVATPLSLRASLGSSRADFGTQLTNIVPRRPLDFSIGGVWQLVGRQ
jgi:hypothetical protein